MAPWTERTSTSSSSSSNNFPNFPDIPEPKKSLHPAAIFGIVAGCLIAVSLTIWLIFFCFVKKALTNKEYGILPSARIAANRYNGGAGPNNPNYGHDSNSSAAGGAGGGGHTRPYNPYGAGTPGPNYGGSEDGTGYNGGYHGQRGGGGGAYDVPQMPSGYYSAAAGHGQQGAGAAVGELGGSESKPGGK